MKKCQQCENEAEGTSRWCKACQTCACCTCGYEWPRGRDGDHSCSNTLLCRIREHEETIASQERAIESYASGQVWYVNAVEVLGSLRWHINEILQDMEGHNRYAKLANQPLLPEHKIVAAKEANDKVDEYFSGGPKILKEKPKERWWADESVHDTDEQKQCERRALHNITYNLTRLTDALIDELEVWIHERESVPGIKSATASNRYVITIYPTGIGDIYTVKDPVGPEESNEINLSDTENW